MWVTLCAECGAEDLAPVRLGWKCALAHDSGLPERDAELCVARLDADRRRACPCKRGVLRTLWIDEAQEVSPPPHAVTPELARSRPRSMKAQLLFVHVDLLSARLDALKSALAASFSPRSSETAAVVERSTEALRPVIISIAPGAPPERLSPAARDSVLHYVLDALSRWLAAQSAELCLAPSQFDALACTLIGWLLEYPFIYTYAPPRSLFPVDAAVRTSDSTAARSNSLNEEPLVVVSIVARPSLELRNPAESLDARSDAVLWNFSVPLRVLNAIASPGSSIQQSVQH
eukprot:CAMPEP_0185834512 /NCGR_PEP_ID=MMETSP1353-20130828/5480_1 /TAXON_ID=1077150 /ORGANISM="Erythrolobus australicus, Strain CCMP3124" /LENGTH=288 /DNA_ID=CAMNT_0028532955 /DNA_START=42 /DNA_END=905 /DNA_ORIENTATION=+